MSGQTMLIGVLTAVLIYFAAVTTGLVFDNIRLQIEIGKLKTRCEMLEPGGR